MWGLRRASTGRHLQLSLLNATFVSGLFAFSIILVSSFFCGNPGWVEDGVDNSGGRTGFPAQAGAPWKKWAGE